MNMSEEEGKLPEVVMATCPEQKILRGQKALVTGGNSGIGKAVDMKGFADVLATYDLLPNLGNVPVAYILPSI